MLQVLVAFSPLLMKALPADPAQLDHFLEQGGLAALTCRSDDAAPISIQRYEHGEWVPVS